MEQRINPGMTIQEFGGKSSILTETGKIRYIPALTEFVILPELQRAGLGLVCAGLSLVSLKKKFAGALDSPGGF